MTEKTPATPRQLAALRKLGVRHAPAISKEEASKLIKEAPKDIKERLEEIKAQHPLEDVVRQFTHQEPDRGHKIFAPWRQEDTPSVHIYPDGKWHDFGTGEHGDVFDLVGKIHFPNYDPALHLPDVIDLLGATTIAPLPAQPTREPPKKTPRRLALEEVVAYHDNLPAERRAWWRDERGLTDQTIDKFLLGWNGRRYTIPLLYRLVPFGLKMRRSEIDDGYEVKYLMSKDCVNGLFNADVLWGATRCLITEGEIDTMIADQWGYTATCSTGGAGTWKPEWIKFFAHIPQIYVIYDNDKAGVEGALRVRASIRRAKILTLPAGIKDIGELHKEGLAESWLRSQIK